MQIVNVKALCTSGRNGDHFRFSGFELEHAAAVAPAENEVLSRSV